MAAALGDRRLGPAVRALLGRSQLQPQALIGDLIATYWPHHADLIPSAALVEVLRDFGLSSASSRTALSRLARRGRITRSQAGRRTFYRHTTAGAERLADARRQLAQYGPEPAPWDGRWTTVAFNVPERERAQRHLLRSRLRNAGFRPLYDAIWISPRVAATTAHRLLAALAPERWTVLTGEITTSIDPVSVFDLVDGRRRFDEYVNDFSAFSGATLTPAEALVVRTLAWDRWRDIVRADLDVPAALLPAGWPRAEASDLFHQLQDGLAISAQRRIADIVDELS